ncbi:hypothetical protein ElyMa_003683500 [Elysia marginata]|uniref:SMB domain-containing protein n=1 Tax=Elysia marginata TaxID=1093978 RepID=A0AAV4F0C7_9GAST|nr:hypothetical protein ElyMa_003683500 [Elysia marginata]
MQLSTRTSIILWSCLFVCHDQRLTQTWDYKTEHWEDFHIRFCGMVCDNGNGTFEYLHEYLCPLPSCVKCDCAPTCSILGTCCPYGSLQPNGTFIRLEDKPDQFQPPPPYPEQIHCAQLPLGDIFLGYLQVGSCPPIVDGTPAKDLSLVQTRKLCAMDPDKTPDLDSLLPYIDVRNGILFKNKFCAICNGYEVSKGCNVSGSSSDIRACGNKLAVPWPLHVDCFHYQELYSSTLELDFARAASSNRMCSIFYDEAPSVNQPRKCYVDPPDNYENYANCSEPMRSLCRDLNDAYLAVSGFKNLFCAMCHGIEPVLEGPIYGCYISNGFSGETPYIISNRKSPLTLLLGVSQTTKSYQSTLQNECSSEIEWMDKDVSRLVLKK